MCKFCQQFVAHDAGALRIAFEALELVRAYVCNDAGFTCSQLDRDTTSIDGLPPPIEAPPRWQCQERQPASAQSANDIADGGRHAFHSRAAGTRPRSPRGFGGHVDERERRALVSPCERGHGASAKVLIRIPGPTSLCN